MCISPNKKFYKVAVYIRHVWIPKERVLMLGSPCVMGGSPNKKF